MRLRRFRLLDRFAQNHLLSEVAGTVDFKKDKIKRILLVCVVALSVVALARPQWGFEWQESKRQGLDILVVIDTSRSMLTQDVKPNRLERAKMAVKDLLKKVRGDRVGVIAFAGDAFLVCPLTVDYSGVMLTLEDLSTDTMPRGGTNLSVAIKEAMKEYDNVPSKYKAIFVLTDGENLEGEPFIFAKKAKMKGIKIYCVGIGTQAGELIQIENVLGQKEFLKDENGNFVKSRLNEKLLQDIALATGGIYVRASGAQFGLDLIYEQELTKMEKREIATKMEKKFLERFQFPLGIACLVLFVEMCVVIRKKE